jgi:hypothetical protein
MFRLRCDCFRTCDERQNPAELSCKSTHVYNYSDPTRLKWRVELIELCRVGKVAFSTSAYQVKYPAIVIQTWRKFGGIHLFYATCGCRSLATAAVGYIVNLIKNHKKWKTSGLSGLFREDIVKSSNNFLEVFVPGRQSSSHVIVC